MIVVLSSTCAPKYHILENITIINVVIILNLPIHFTIQNINKIFVINIKINMYYGK